MNETRHCVVFSLDDQYFALPLSSVERIVRAVSVTPLPKTSEIVLGIINLHGRILPVINIRRRFSLPDTEIDANHHFIIGKTSEVSVAILVDNVMDIVEISEDQFVQNKEILSNLPYISGVLKQEEQMILVHDIEKLLSLNEVKAIQSAIQDLEPVPEPKKAKKTSRRKK
jgi:purine-binding chemotaxis protein CheW